MSDPCAAMSAIVQATQAQEATLSLMQGGQSRFFYRDRRTDKVLLFFHGFTATPEQFVPIATVFYEAGYNVLVPRLPGHGLAGDWNRHQPPPLPEDEQVYQAFGEFWLQQARAFGDRVVIGGLSGGSTLATWLALKHSQQVDRALLFAPYLSNSNIAVGLIVRILDIYFEWQTPPTAANLGYPGFLMPALRLFLELGQAVFDLAEGSPAAPMLIVSSDRDLAVNNKDLAALFASVLPHQPRSWYFNFDAQFDVGHNMMTEAEGNECVDFVFAIAKAYVQSDLTWAEVEALRDLVHRGERFDQAVAILGVGDRTSPDVQTLVTLMVEA